MKLSPALICRELSQVYRTSAGSSLSLKPTLKRPMLLGLDEKPGPGTLCILAPDDSRAASAHPSALLVAVGKGSAGSGQLMVDAPSLGDVYNQIQKIFNRYESWYTELVESRLQGQSIQALLELLKHQFVKAEQADTFGRIVIRYNPDHGEEGSFGEFEELE